MIHIYTVEGTMISRCEMFDEADLEAALARFDELSRRRSRLDNAASQSLRASLEISLRSATGAL